MASAKPGTQPARPGSGRWPGAPRGPVNGRRRRRRYLALGVGAVVVASLAFDLGHGSSSADRAGDLTALVARINTDIASCEASVGDSFEAYTEVVRGRPDERRAAEGIISGDEPNCTPEANSDLYDMATEEVPGTLRPFGLQAVLADVDAWAFPDGAAAITDVGRLLDHRSDRAAATDLRRRLADMGRLDNSAQALLDAAGHRLGVRVERLDLGAAHRLGRGTF